MSRGVTMGLARRAGHRHGQFEIHVAIGNMFQRNATTDVHRFRSGSDCRDTAVDEELMARDETAFIRRQEKHGTQLLRDTPGDRAPPCSALLQRRDQAEGIKLRLGAILDARYLP